MMTQEGKLEYLFSLKSDTIRAHDIYKLFNKKAIANPNTGKVEITPPEMYPYDKIIVKKGQLPNVKEDIESTAGRYLYNLIVIAAAFSDKIDYINKTLRDDDISKLQSHLSDELLMGRITGAEFGKYQTRTIWLNNFTEIFMPSTSSNLICLPADIRNELQRLIDENKECILKNDVTTYLNKVETPILEYARKWFIDHNEPGWVQYAKGGKPKFKNVFKSMFLEIGPILDITTGKYKISTTNYMDGIPPEENYLYANQGVFGAYNRAVNTQVGGAKTKEFAQAFQSQVVTEEDCGSQYTIGIDVTKDNLSSIKWKWIRDEKNPNEFICVTPDNLNSFIGKHVEARSPMFCMSDNYCWKCVGDMYKRIGIKNVGLASQKLTSTFLNKSLKSFHDTSLSTTRIPWKDCIFEMK